MNATIDRFALDALGEEKKLPYEVPRLTCFGRIGDLTRGSGSKPGDAGNQKVKAGAGGGDSGSASSGIAFCLRGLSRRELGSSRHP